MNLDFDKNGNGLLPVIIQDDLSLKVLMLGYMNREALDKSLLEQRVTFFSRTRKELWTKGETSGNFLNIVSVFPDCDNDTLLIRVRPDGPVCHRGTVSCFNTPEDEGFINKLQDVIEQRHNLMPDNSYTTLLFKRGVKKIGQKVGEEAVETLIEAVDGNRERYIYEVSDLMYHLLVLNKAMNCNMLDIETELAKRHK